MGTISAAKTAGAAGNNMGGAGDFGGFIGDEEILTQSEGGGHLGIDDLARSR